MRVRDLSTTLMALLAMLLILLCNSMYVDYKLSKIETKLDEYFAPVEDIPLPDWEVK